MEDSIKLPKSGVIVFLKQKISYGEYRQIEAILLAGTTTKMVNGVMTPAFDGSVVATQQKKIIETFVIRAENPDGSVCQINIEMDKLDMDDGLVLETECMKRYNELKKN